MLPAKILLGASTVIMAMTSMMPTPAAVIYGHAASSLGVVSRLSGLSIPFRLHSTLAQGQESRSLPAHAESARGWA